MSKKAKSLDQFYTNPDVANELFQIVISKISKPNRKVFLEPSAGSGSFSNIMRRHATTFAFDLDPKAKGVKKIDFFDVSKNEINNEDAYGVCTIGNPPFGKNSSLAVRFFNHATSLSDTICFVVPKTFMKKSIHNRLNLNFKLIYNKILPQYSFLFKEEPYDVPCTFQIWTRSSGKRRVVKSPNSCKFFEFVPDASDANFAVRRAGGRSGTAFLNTSELSPQSNYFCKTRGSHSPEYVVNLINEIDFVKIASSTAGVRSISKGELIREVVKSSKK